MLNVLIFTIMMFGISGPAIPEENAVLTIERQSPRRKRK